MTLTRFLVAWRTTPLHDREVIDALVDPNHAAPSPELVAALRAWPGPFYWSDEPDGRHLVLTRSTSAPREAWTLHVILLLATLFTTTVTGAAMSGTVPRISVVLNPAAWDLALLRALAGGFAFSIPLLAILFCHEMGHYLAARYYKLDVSPPFFLPGPPAPFIGTFGAFIRLRTILADRRQLLDVGAAGPLAGFLIAVPILWYGLANSQMVDARSTWMAVDLGWGSLLLGNSPITLLLRQLTDTGDGLVQLHPAAFAGWLGMYVTLLNLLPIAQLDGGHILYAAAPRFQRQVSRAFWVLLIVMGYFSTMWLFWGIIVLLLSRGQFGHPPVLDVYRPLPKSRLWLLVASVLLFLITFTPIPQG